MGAILWDGVKYHEERVKRLDNGTLWAFDASEQRSADRYLSYYYRFMVQIFDEYPTLYYRTRPKDADVDFPVTGLLEPFWSVATSDHPR